MADIVAEVEQEALIEASTASVCYDIVIDSRRFHRWDVTLGPEEARNFAADAGLVIWDSCGCGSCCSAYEIYAGREVELMLEAGLPEFRSGSAGVIEDEHGNLGLLLEGNIRWGPLQ